MSNISFQTINEQFPVAGEDNDTQVFRDNFDSIKQALRVANEEITDIQENTARLDDDVDFNLQKIQNAILENVRDQKLLGFEGSNVNVSPTTVDFQLGNYHIYKVASGTNEEPFILDFLNFPGDPTLFGSSNIGVGKVTLELYGDGQERVVVFGTSETAVIKKNNFPLINGNGDLILQSDSDPVFIEVWRWNANTIYVKYLGFLDQENTESLGSTTVKTESSTVVSSGNIDIDLSQDLLTVTLDQSVNNVTFSNVPPLGAVQRTLLIVQQNETGNFTFGTGGVIAPNGSLSISQGSNATSVIEFVAYGGETFLAHLVGSNYI